MTTPDKKMIAIPDWCSLRDKKLEPTPTPTTASLLEWIDEVHSWVKGDLKSPNEWAKDRRGISARWDAALTALRAIVVGAEAERAKVKWLRAALEDSNGLLKSMLGNEANEGGAFGDQLIDNETALAETEPKEDEHE
jgi:hypothetical protein